ncbi:MAG: ferrochelatase [Rhodothermales bacterium]|nr:ferrochelatase [Rhodothermales bacterium]
MTAREFLHVYRYDQRLITGAYYPQDPVRVEEGDTVGVVLMNLGGPRQLDEVEPFLYNLFMDPAIIDIPLPKRLRHPLCRFIARKRSASVGEDYEQIGGGSPINRLTGEQAAALERRLNERYGAATGARYRTYIAMRYWHPTSEDALRQMQADGVTKVVLLPLYPQYSKTTTGSSLVYWKALEENGELPQWPTSLVYEYATHPLYVQALSERIDEALQRFPRSVRDRAHLLFSAHGTPVKEMKKRRDPYCCLVHSTVQAVMDFRQQKEERPFHVAFQSKVGPAEWLTPSTPEKLEELANEGHTAVLVIPVAFVTDHIETAFELDIEVREEAEHFGIEHYEVTSGLNCHPLFIEALVESVAAQVEAARLTEGDGAAAVLPRPIPSLPRIKAKCRSVRCHQCLKITEAHDWRSQPGVATPETVRLRTGTQGSA